MKEAIVELAIESPSDLQLFGETVSVFANWRQHVETEDVSSPSDATSNDDVPELMVRSAYDESGERKIVTFQDRKAAAAFLQIWRNEKRRLT
jgi:hypothetical protein